MVEPTCGWFHLRLVQLQVGLKMAQPVKMNPQAAFMSGQLNH